MSNEGGTASRKLSGYGVVSQLGDVVRMTLDVRAWVELADGGVRFALGPAPARLTVTVHVTDEDLYDTVLFRAGHPLVAYLDVWPFAIGAIVRQMVHLSE